MLTPTIFTNVLNMKLREHQQRRSFLVSDDEQPAWARQSSSQVWSPSRAHR